jgi:tetratricopeptide (TPR) repeat protein
MYKKTLTFLSVFTAVLFFISCTKEVPKEMLNKQMPMNQQQMPDDSIHRNLSQQDPHSTMQDDTVKGDTKAEQMVKEADDADAKYQKTKSDADKKVCIEKQMAAANYLMFEANLSPKKKYRPALKRYRRVLELDPNNDEAKQNKTQIEEIYKSMGMQIPE